MRRFFEWLSIPILVVPVTVLIFWLLAGASPLSQRWFLVFLLNVVFLPLASIIWLKRRRFVSDLDLRSKPERLAFMGLMLLVSLVNFFDSNILSAPRVIQVLNLLVLVLVGVMGLVTVFWKVSGHLMVLTAVITIAYFIKGRSALLWVLILPPVAWHRFYFKHHSLAQVGAGLFLGLLLPLLIVFLFGLR